MIKQSQIQNPTLIIITFSFLFLTFYLACEKNKNPINPMSKTEIILKLSGEPRPKEILLKLELKNIDLPVQYQITRDNNLILSGQLVINDSIFKDSGLAPSTQYTYQAFISQNGGIVSASNILKANTMDTTSHNYVWTIDTIGSFGSSLFDVFAISENDVWAVGEIDTGIYPPFNAAH